MCLTGDDTLPAAPPGHGWWNTWEVYGSANLIPGQRGLGVLIPDRVPLLRTERSDQEYTAHTQHLHGTDSEITRLI